MPDEHYRELVIMTSAFQADVHDLEDRSSPSTAPATHETPDRIVQELTLVTLNAPANELRPNIASPSHVPAVSPLSDAVTLVNYSPFLRSVAFDIQRITPSSGTGSSFSRPPSSSPCIRLPPRVSEELSRSLTSRFSALSIAESAIEESDDSRLDDSFAISSEGDNSLVTASPSLLPVDPGNRILNDITTSSFSYGVLSALSAGSALSDETDTMSNRRFTAEFPNASPAVPSSQPRPEHGETRRQTAQEVSSPPSSAPPRSSPPVQSTPQSASQHSLIEGDGHSLTSSPTISRRLQSNKSTQTRDALDEILSMHSRADEVLTYLSRHFRVRLLSNTTAAPVLVVDNTVIVMAPYTSSNCDVGFLPGAGVGLVEVQERLDQFHLGLEAGVHGGDGRKTDDGPEVL